jgi:hypothetical protein
MTRILRNLSAVVFLVAATLVTAPTPVSADHTCYHGGENIGLYCRNQYGMGGACMACAENQCTFFSMGHPACLNECMGGAQTICYA